MTAEERKLFFYFLYCIHMPQLLAARLRRLLSLLLQGLN